MNKVYKSLFIMIVVALIPSACGAKPTDVVPCPPPSNMTGECQILPGSQAMVANRSVPVALENATYVEVTAPDKSILTTHVMFGYANVIGEGTNVLKIYRVGQGAATVNVFVSSADYPVKVSFNGYKPYSQK